MVRKNSRRALNNKMKGRNGDPDQRIIQASFRQVTSLTASTTASTFAVAEVDLSPGSLGTRAAAFGDIYQKYRVIGLRARGFIQPGNTATTLRQDGNVLFMMAVYYGPKSTYTVPASVAQFCQFPHFSAGAMTDVHLKVGRKDLMSHRSIPWYQTIGTGADDIEFYQLNLELGSLTYFTGTNASQMYVIIDVDIEFTGSVDPALIPLRGPITVYQKSEDQDDLEEKQIKIINPKSPSSFVVVNENINTHRPPTFPALVREKSVLVNKRG